MSTTIPVDRMRQVFSQALGLPAEEITEDLAYSTVPQWDSIAHMALIAALEDAFNVMIDMDDVVDMSSVAKARDILRKLGANV